MIKQYCDRCGIEIKQAHKERIPKTILSNGRDFISEDIDLCDDCLQKLNLFEDALIPNILNLRVSLYKNFMRKDKIDYEVD